MGCQGGRALGCGWTRVTPRSADRLCPPRQSITLSGLELWVPEAHLGTCLPCASSPFGSPVAAASWSLFGSLPASHPLPSWLLQVPAPRNVGAPVPPCLTPAHPLPPMACVPCWMALDCAAIARPLLPAGSSPRRGPVRLTSGDSPSAPAGEGTRTGLALGEPSVWKGGCYVTKSTVWTAEPGALGVGAPVVFWPFGVLRLVLLVWFLM